ncbi:protein of unknown function DUF2415, partial [Teratosphaeria destructans]
PSIRTIEPSTPDHRRRTIDHRPSTPHHRPLTIDDHGVHFGGGNIGRGFVAQFLHNSGYEVVFVDVMDSMIESLQKNRSYHVTEVGADGERTFTIDNYRAINSKHDMDHVIDEIATADTVTCAVGPNILKFIAEPIARGIEARKRDDPLAVIACENMVGGTDALRGFVEQKITDEATKDHLPDKARFANSAIDRIVPIQDEGAGLDVKIEKFYEWCVEKTPFKPHRPPPIDGVHYVDNLQPYIERKLFTVNTGHATAAYYGYAAGKKYIADVLADEELHEVVQRTLQETAHLIVTKHDHISAQEQHDYVQAIVKRIGNPVLKDVVERVGRQPLRKLSRHERFIGPAAHLAERGDTYDGLLGGIEKALRFQNVEGDEESVELAKKLKGATPRRCARTSPASRSRIRSSRMFLNTFHDIGTRDPPAARDDGDDDDDDDEVARRARSATTASLRGGNNTIAPAPAPPTTHPRHSSRGTEPAAKMAIDTMPIQYPDATDLAHTSTKTFYPVRIPVSHWQLRHYISTPEPDSLYYASEHDVYCLNTATKKRKHVATLPFSARCTASGYGWVCVGGEEDGHFAAIKLDGRAQQDVDGRLPVSEGLRGHGSSGGGARRAPEVRVERIGEEIVNSISIHRVQDEEAHLDDIVAVLTNNDKTVRVYSLPLGIETTVLDLPFAMNHATISPDGTTLVAVGDFNQAYFFEREIMETPPQIPKPHNRLTSSSIEWTLSSVVNLHVGSGEQKTLGYFTTAWSPSGRLVAVGSEGGYITVLDMEILQSSEYEDQEAVVAVVPSSRADLPQPHAGAVRSMMFAPDPWDLLIWAEDQGRICIGDLRTGLKSKQVVHLEPKAEGLKKVSYEDVPSQPPVHPGRDIDELEDDFVRRYSFRNAPDNVSAVNFATEYIEARRRQRQQRQDMAAVRAQQQRERREALAMEDDPQGLTASEQQILESLRTTRQREEARSNTGVALNVNYVGGSMFGSTRNTTAPERYTPEASGRSISDILSSVQDTSFPELSRTHAASPGRERWDDLDRLSARASGSRLPQPRRRASVVLTPPTSNPGSSATSSALPTINTRASRSPSHISRSPMSPPELHEEDEEGAGHGDDDENPWRTIEQHMTLARGPLFEGAGRAEAHSPIPAPSTDRPSRDEIEAELAIERARARSLARLREQGRWRIIGEQSPRATAASGPPRYNANA